MAAACKVVQEYLAVCRLADRETRVLIIMDWTMCHPRAVSRLAGIQSPKERIQVDACIHGQPLPEITLSREIDPVVIGVAWTLNLA
jgi:hypothetical protein